MIKLIISLFIFCLSFLNGKIASDLNYLRQNYKNAVSDKILCRTLINELKNKNDEIVFLAYLGAFQTIWAKHTANPVSKIKTFNEGKNNIEKAVKKQPKNFEIRFLRLSVQKNAPVFLGYSDDIDEDESFLKDNLKNVKSSDLLKLIYEILKLK